MHNRRLLTWILCLGVVASSCAGEPEPYAEGETVEVVDLPAPALDGETAVEAALAERHSVREFTDEPLTTSQIGQLLWAAQGVTRDWGGRTNPSAGALYPLEVYVLTEGGLLHYLPDGHRVGVLLDGDLRGRLASAALGQEAVRDAAAVFVVCGVYARTEAKYGSRAVRYVHLEAGHVGQSILLEAVALGLGAVPIGAFDDGDVQAVLGLPSDHEPLYLIPVGHPSE